MQFIKFSALPAAKRINKSRCETPFLGVRQPPAKCAASWEKPDHNQSDTDQSHCPLLEQVLPAYGVTHSTPVHLTSLETVPSVLLFLEILLGNMASCPRDKEQRSLKNKDGQRG